MKKYLAWKILVIIIVSLALGFFDLPSEVQKKVMPFLPARITDTKLQLGLDLQGGSQLDYKIDLRTVAEADRQSIIDGVLNVIEKRVNGLGVAEPNIYTSKAGDETHIIVELAENANITQNDVDKYLGPGKVAASLTDDDKKAVSLEKAKATVGKTIQLEFKEEKDKIDPAEKDKVVTLAQTALDKIKKGSDFSVIGQEDQQGYPATAKYEKVDYTFESELNSKLKDAVVALKPGNVYSKLVETGGTFKIDENGKTVEETGMAIVKLVDSKQEIKDKKAFYVSHILISYKDAQGADASITRSEDDAYKIAKEVKDKLAGGADFATLAQQYSDDKSNKDKGGRLDKAVTGDGTYAYDFEQASMGLKKEEDVSDITKSQFGYHLIKLNKLESDIKETQYKYETITYSTVPNPWKDTGLTGKNFKHADVQLNNFYQPYVTIQFDEAGAKLFEEITGRNVNKRVAIFVGGQLISAPNVNEKISGGNAQISGQFTNDEAKALARDLNTGAIPAPIVLAGEYTIGATLGKEASTKSLYAGLIGFILVAILMITYYRVPGLIATLALFSYSVILIFLLKAQFHLAWALLAALAVFGFLIAKIISNKDAGWEKLLSFILSCAAFFFLTYLLKTGVVLTLAGIGGIIMSIGMAVDANVLIFERFKEEMRLGKTYAAAMESGFDKAWTAIRDSNFTTLLICAVLFAFGSSTIKGFAFSLAAGIVVSMFSAITITRTLMYGLVGKPISQNLKLLGTDRLWLPKFKFIKNAKYWLYGSATLFIISILSFFVFGLNLGFDFTGGTLLEFKFNEPITKEALATAIKDAGEEITASATSNTATITDTTVAPENSDLQTPTLTTDQSAKPDLRDVKIISSGENKFVIKTKYITSDTHDQLIDKLQNKVPEFTELRFATIGAVIGKSTLMSALKAIVIALLIIIAYVAFAFRKVPKEVSPWRFGASAIIALIHDVTIVAGFFIILGQIFNVEIDALFITAMLTVFGYSVNDTIIIFDKTRDNLINAGRDEKIGDITDKSLNETFARSLNTTSTTLLALLAVLIFGSSSIFFFILALTVGIFLGTYSSIFVASPILVFWNNYAHRNKMNK